MERTERIALGVLSCTLAKSEWTHEAHVRYGCDVVRRHGDNLAALDVLRASIRNYNEATGVANTDSSGYHETLTAYYCGAVAHLLVICRSDHEIVSHPLAARDAPLRYWDREALFSVTARRNWVSPARSFEFPSTVLEALRVTVDENPVRVS